MPNPELQKVDVNLDQIKFAHQRPCQTVYGIAKALLLPESIVSHEPENGKIPTERILRLIFQAIAKDEGASETIDLPKTSQQMDIPARINQITTKEELVFLKERIEKLISRLKISLDGSESYTISSTLINEFIGALFLFAQEKVNTDTQVNSESILEYMKVQTINDLRQLIQPIGDDVIHPESRRAATLIVDLLSPTENATLYDTQPFLDRFKALNDPDDVSLLFEANAKELNCLTENQQYLVLQKLFKICEYDSLISVMILNSYLIHIDTFSRRITVLTNELFRSVVEVLIFEQPSRIKDIALETLHIAKNKDMLIPLLLVDALEYFYQERSSARSQIDTLATCFTNLDLISPDPWEEYKKRINKTK